MMMDDCSRRSVEISHDKYTGDIELLELDSSFESGMVTEETEISTDLSVKAMREEEREFFQKARKCLAPGALFRNIVRLYAERKLIVFFWIHFTSTMIVWTHFALVKFEAQAESVPCGAPRYWWKRLVPPLEFGSMHAILLQMALIPITMARYTITRVSGTVVDKIIPLNRTLQMHIHLGYTMIIIVTASVLLFFTFFGLLCSDGDENFCAKFTSEIMITGYAIIASLLLIGVTSHYRHSIPYEIFYTIHHLVFIVYFITIAHTLDVQQRSGNKNRSQTFVWFSSTLAFYFCDRAAMYMNDWYETKLQDSSVVTGSDGSKTIFLRMKRPTLLSFRPGNYVYLKIRSIDQHWHPFSIASCPSSSTLEFAINSVPGGTSWTSTLCNLLESNGGRLLLVEVMGPYGTSIANMESYSHILAIGAGTGVVPILSLYKEYIRGLLKKEPNNCLFEMRNRERHVQLMEMAEEQQKGSMLVKAVGGCKNEGNFRPRSSRNQRRSAVIRSSVDRHDKLVNTIEVRSNSKNMRKAAAAATRSLYGVVLLSSLPVMGMTLLGLTISWNTIPIELHPAMVEILKVFTVLFQILYAVVSLFIWDGDGILSFVDVTLCLVSPFADWYYFQVCDRHGSLRPPDILTYSILILYMTGRVWARTVSPRHSTWQRVASQTSGSMSKVDKLNFVWTTNCASQVAGLLPDILSQWDLLVAAWGLENALDICTISIYVTDADEKACRQLRSQIQSTSLYSNGAIKFHRANLERVIENHSIDLICTRSSSHSLLAFCGSPTLAREVHKCKISNDMVVAITGNKKHQMDFISESYGGPKRQRLVSPIEEDNRGDDSTSETPVATRKSMRYSLRRRSSLQDIMASAQDDKQL